MTPEKEIQAILDLLPEAQFLLRFEGNIEKYFGEVVKPAYSHAKQALYNLHDRELEKMIGGAWKFFMDAARSDADVAKRKLRVAIFALEDAAKRVKEL
jgi:hypothetical protein